MGMINCKDCGKEMSDAALACPNCGKPAKQQEVRSVGLLLGIGIFFVPLLFGWLTLRKGHSNMARGVTFGWMALFLVLYANRKDDHSEPSQRTAVRAESAQTETKVMEVQVHEILAAYKGNEVGADNTYKGKRVKISGVVDDVKKDILDSLYVTVGTGAQFEIPQVQAFFEDEMNDRLAKLQKGQRITVTCDIDGLMMNVIGQNCQLE